MIKIISDSTCDLSQELIEKHNIDIVPLHILLGEQEYEDGKNISPDEIYAWSDENKTTPKTSAAGIEQVMETTLQGRDGYETVRVDNMGKVLEIIEEQSVQPSQGNSVYTTLDADLQIAY